jgi:hypothetical protein
MRSNTPTAAAKRAIGLVALTHKVITSNWKNINHAMHCARKQAVNCRI